MKISISQLESSLLGKTGGRKLTNIPNYYSVVQECLNKLMARVTLPSSRRKQTLLTPFQELPYLRLLPNDIAEQGFIDAYKRDYTNYQPRIRTGVYSTEFMRKVGQGLIGIEHLEGEQYINLRDSDYNTVNVLDNCDDSTNGTWVAVGTSTDISYNESYKLSGTASIQFSSSPTSADFGISKSDYADVAVSTDMAYITLNAFFPIYVPTVKIRYGTDSLNYYEVTATLGVNGKRFTTGWNTIAFDLSTQTTTGTVSSEDITYFAFLVSGVTITTLTDTFKLDSVYLTDTYLYDLTYYSNSVVIDQWGSRRDNNLIQSTSDFLLLNEVEKNLFLMQFSVVTAIDNRPDSGVSEYNVYSGELEKAFEKFEMEYPSEKIIFSSEY